MICILQRIHVITSTLQSKLEESFQRGMESKDKLMLTQCLQTYASINRCQAAEGLFQTLVVHPHMDKVRYVQVETNISAFNLEI